jgi:hypothetical protein
LLFIRAQADCQSFLRPSSFLQKFSLGPRRHLLCASSHDEPCALGALYAKLDFPKKQATLCGADIFVFDCRSGRAMKTLWNTSEGRTSRSDRVDILVTRSELTVDFCYSEEAGAPQDADTAPVVARIVMNPHTAKRLAETLARAIERHERIFGSIDEKAMAGGKLLRSLIDDLAVPHGYEYSFKMCEGLILSDRFLVTMDKASLGKNYRKRVIELCGKLRAPSLYLEAIESSIAEARILHFGFESSEKGGMHKIYLEFPLPSLSEPTLVHTSYKWDPLHPERRAIGTYMRHPVNSYDDTAERVRNLLAECHKPGAFEIADELLRFAMPGLKENFHYLEVTEDGNPRKSFDVNFYGASLTMDDIRVLLLRMAARYSLSIEEFEARLKTVEKMRFGHITGGIDREGRDFFTFHFGVQARRR